MQASNLSSNPLIQSVVHQSLQRATRELGLPELPKGEFMKEIAPLLRTPDSLFEDTPMVQAKLWSAVQHGEVIAAEILDDLAFAFFVRAALGARRIDLRLVCHQKAWHIDALVSMYTKPVRASHWFSRSIFAGSVVVAGILGYSLHGALQTPAAAAYGSTINSPAKGSPQTTKQTSKSPTTASATSASTTTATSPTTQPATPKPTTSTAHAKQKPVPQKLAFTLKEGMPLNDLSQFLKAHHLVSSAVSFDMLMKKTKADQDVRPGTYQFTSNMNQQQLIDAVKKGPSK